MGLLDQKLHQRGPGMTTPRLDFLLGAREQWGETDAMPPDSHLGGGGQYQYNFPRQEPKLEYGHPMPLNPLEHTRPQLNADQLQALYELYQRDPSRAKMVYDGMVAQHQQKIGGI